METTRAAMPSAASRSRAASASSTSEPVASKVTLASAAPAHFIGAFGRQIFRRVCRVRTVGTSWREKAQQAGAVLVRPAPSASIPRFPPRRPGGITMQIRNGAQRRQMLDRLMGRAVFAHADGIMGHHENDANAHQRGQADRRAAIIREHHEGAAIGNDRRHAAPCRSSPPPCHARGCRNGYSGRRNRRA